MTRAVARRRCHAPHPKTTVALSASTGTGADPVGSDWDAWNTKYGRYPNVGCYYHAWGTEDCVPNSTITSALLSRGMRPNTAWSPGNSYTMANIAAGTYDSYINAQAAIAKSYRHPMEVRLFHEFNSPSSAYGPSGATDADFVAAYQHVIDLFRAAGVTNVTWVWCADFWVSGGSNQDPTPRYPGDGYVNVIGWDGYSTAGFTKSLDFILAPNYATLTALPSTPKPFHVSESGTSVTSQKTTWYSTAIPGAGGGLLARYPLLSSFSVFDRVSDADYTIDGSGAFPAADTAFEAIIAAAPFV